MKVQDMAQNLYSDTRGQSERPVTFTEAVIGTISTVYFIIAVKSVHNRRDKDGRKKE